MRHWCKDHPNPNRPEEGSVAHAILSKEPKIQAKFSRVFNALSKAKMSKTPRFTPNPESYWGPGTRAGNGGQKRKRFMSAPKDGASKAAKGQGMGTGETASEEPRAAE